MSVGTCDGSRAEIAQAYADYQSTQLDGSLWRGDDPVHPREQGRFTRRQDGRGRAALVRVTG